VYMCETRAIIFAGIVNGVRIETSKLGLNRRDRMSPSRALYARLHLHEKTIRKTTKRRMSLTREGAREGKCAEKRRDTRDTNTPYVKYLCE